MSLRLQMKVGCTFSLLFSYEEKDADIASPHFIITGILYSLGDLQQGAIQGRSFVDLWR